MSKKVYYQRKIKCPTGKISLSANESPGIRQIDLIHQYLLYVHAELDARHKIIVRLKKKLKDK